MPRTLAVDICNTLADVNGELQKVFGANPNPSSYLHPGVNAEFFKNNTWIFKKAKPYKGAAYILNQLSKIFEIVYVTARPIEARMITLEWLNKHGFPKREVFFTKNKPEIAKCLGVTVAIEDAPHEIDRYRIAGIPVLVKRQPYNLNYHNVFEWTNLRASLLREALYIWEGVFISYEAQANVP